MEDSNIKPIFRIISLVLITTFIALDISWAYPPDQITRSSTLAAPSLLQREPVNEHAVRLQRSMISDGNILGSVCAIAKILLEEKVRIKFLDETLRKELAEAVQGIDLLHVEVKENGVVLIPCEREGKKSIIWVALKGNDAVKDLKGYYWLVSDKYVVKELPEDLKDPEKIVKEERLSFVMIKPDGIAEKDLIIEKLEKGLEADGGRIVKIFDPVRLDEAKAREFYKEHEERTFFKGLIAYIQSGIVIPILVQSGKRDAIKNVRDDIVGPTPGIIKETGAVVVGTIRGDLMTDADRRAQPIPNRIHASDSVANVVREASLVVGKDTFAGALYEDIIVSIKQELDRRGEVSFEELFDLVRSLVPSSMENLHKALAKLKPLSGRKDDVEDTEILTAIARAKKDYGLSDRETEILRLAFLGTGQGMGPRFEELESKVLLSAPAVVVAGDNPVYDATNAAIVASNFDYSSNDTVRASDETLSVNLISKTAVVTRSDGGTATFTKIALVNTAVSPVPKKLLRAGDYTDPLGRAWSVYGRLSELKGFKDAAGTPIDMTTKKIVIFTYADSVQKLFSKVSVYDPASATALPAQPILTSISIDGRNLNIYGTFSAFKNAKYTVTQKNLKITIVNRSNSRDKKTFSVGPKGSILSDMNLTADHLYYTVRTNGVSKLKSFDLHTGAPLATISPVDVNTQPDVPAQPSLVSVQSGDRRLFVRDRLPDGTLGQQYALISKGVNWSPASIGMDPAAITQEFVKWYQADIPLMAQMGINVVRVYHDFGTGQDAMNILDMFYNYGIKVIMTVDSPQHGVIADMNNISTVVDAYKNHPAILMWAIGNEWDINNYYGTFTSLEQSAQFTEQAAQLIKSLDSNHPVTSVIGDIDKSGVTPLSTANNIVNNLVPDVDVWGINVYRGLSLGVVFQQWRTISQKPMLIAEFGADSYDHRINGQNQAMQASMDTGIWDEVFFDLSAERTDGATVGVLAFEWNDEWWKDGSNAIHNVASGTNYSQPDGYADEEWFGVVGIDRAPKTLYSQLQTRYLNGQSAVVLNSTPTITVTSQGNQSGASSFSVNGKSAFYRAGGAGGGRGINVAILDSHTGIRMDDARTFDTWTGQGGFGGLHTNFQQLIDYLNSLPDGTVISLSICDEGGFTMVDGTPWPNDPYVTAAYQTLESLGSTKIRNVGYWGGWAMVTVKGQGVVAEAYSSPNAPVMIQAQVSLMLDPNYGKRSAPRAQNMESTAIIAAVNKELDQKKEWMFPELFSIVQSKVPVSMAGLTSALTDLQPLSLHSDLNADIMVDAVKQAGEKYGLSEGETEILRLALLGPGQGVGNADAEKLGREATSPATIEIAQTADTAFIELDKKIKEKGFFGATADERYKYIRLLLGNPDLVNHATAMSEACKEGLKSLPLTRKKSFSHVSKYLLVDILEKQKGRTKPLDIPAVRDLDDLTPSPRILLIGPYENKTLKVGSFLAPPLGIYRLANYLRLFGIRVDTFDPNLKPVEELERLVRGNHYDFIGFSVYQPTLNNDLKLAKELKEISPNSLIIGGGEGAYYNRDKLLYENSPFNIIYRGFGEFALLDTMYTYMERKKGFNVSELTKIEGLVLKMNSKLMPTAVPERISRDDYRAISSFFDTSIVPYEEYWRFMESLYKDGRVVDLDDIRTVRLITASHCPMGCTFCSSTNFLNDAIEKKQPVLWLKAEDIIKILKNIEKYHPEVRTVFFNDDNFTINRERVMDFCDLVKNEFKTGRFRFIGLGRVDDADPAMLAKMKEAGFVQLNYGIESFSDKILADMHKKINAGRNIEGINITLQSGIKPMINLIPFYPTVSMADVKETINKSVEFSKKGAELSYWPFVEAFKGSSAMDDVSAGRHVLSADGQFILPDDQDVRIHALKAIEKKAEVLKEISEKYDIEGRVQHVIDVLAFFMAFYREIGESTDDIEMAIKFRLGARDQKIETLIVEGQALKVVVSERINPDLIKPQEFVDIPEEEIGAVEGFAEKKLREGRVGVITVAGGMSSRAKIDYPKGIHPIGPLSDKTLFETRAEEIKAAEKHYGATIPWFIMTSELNDETTRAYFDKNNYFGLGKENVIFILAENVPAFLAGTQELAMKDAKCVLKTPSGHGDIYKAMQYKETRTDGGSISAIEEATKRGIETFIYCQVDNPMPVINKRSLGIHLREQSDFTTISVRKRDQEENLGMPVVDTVKDERFYVEYNQPGAAKLKHKEGFDYGACGIFILSRDFMAITDYPPYHLIREKRAKIYKDGRIQNGFIDKYENFMFDVLPRARKSANILFAREDSFAPFKSLEGPDSPEAVAEAISSYWKRMIKKALPEIEIPRTAIIELPRDAEYMEAQVLRDGLLALGFPGLLEENASLLVSPDFTRVDKKILSLSGNSRELSATLRTEKLSQYEKRILERNILEKYREEQSIGALNKFRYPRDDKDWESTRSAISRARKLYAEDGKVVFMQGVTAISKATNERYGLFRDLSEKIKRWNGVKSKPLVATVANGSEHITIYDLACMLDWERKYRDQLNLSTKAEIEKRSQRLFSESGFGTEKEAREQATYEILTEKVSKVLKNFKADKIPIFKPSHVFVSMPPCGPFAVLLSMEPETAEDLVIVNRLQDAIRDETGIVNSGAFKAHITLGYVVNSIYEDEKAFNEFMQHMEELDRYVMEKREVPECEFALSEIELCSLSNLDEYKTIAAFSWTGLNADHSYHRDETPQLFDITESSLNNERAKFIAVGKKVAGYLDKNMTTTEITERVNRAISALEALDKESVSPEMLASAQFLKKNLNQFEADGGVGSLIILARRAKREGQKLIIGLETDWIPGGNTEHSLQEKAIFALMKEIGDIGEALKSMGLDNVEIVRGSADSLADSLKMAAKTDRFNDTGMHNIVVMASKDTIASENFREFRGAGEKDKPFLTGIDPTELIKLYEKYGESISNQLYIKLAAWLYLTLEVAAGKEPPNLSWIKYDSAARILLLMPGAEIIDYELLKNTYAAEKAALAAA